MKNYETIYALVKITYSKDEKGYWNDLPKEDAEQIAANLAIKPNFNTVECGVALDKVEVKFREENTRSLDNWDMYNSDLEYSK